MTERRDASQPRPEDTSTLAGSSEDVMLVVDHLTGSTKKAEQEALEALQRNTAMNLAGKMEPGDA